MRVCLVCSSGGHFAELYRLRQAWAHHDVCWVTFDTQDTRQLLSNERVYHAHSPTNRNLPNFVRNLSLGWNVLRGERPDLVLSTGAGLAVPLILLGRLLGIRTVYIESLSRVEDLSLTGRLVYRIADEFLVQWPRLAERYGKAIYAGRLV